MKIQQIEAIRKRFRREWLFIAVDEIDEATTTPVRGRLLAHSPHRDEIDQVSIKYRRPALVVFSEDTVPPGYAAAFCSKPRWRLDTIHPKPPSAWSSLRQAVQNWSRN